MTSHHRVRRGRKVEGMSKSKLQHEWAYERTGVLESGMGKHAVFVIKDFRSFKWSVRRAGVQFATGKCKTRHEAMLCAEAVLNVLEEKLWNGGKPR
jgi:hypothetical protein